MVYRIIGIVILFAIIWAIAGVYNNLVELRSHVDDALHHIRVLLQRRRDLVPDLLVTMKSLAIEEWSAVEAVAFAHGIAVAAETPAEMMQADADLSKALEHLFDEVEDHPEIVSNTTFSHLKKLFEESNRQLQVACEEYDQCVLKYNNGIQTFPGNIFARIFQFKEHEGLDAIKAQEDA